MYRHILRGETHHRQRPENSRFVIGSESDSLTRRNITGDKDNNWLGITWKDEYNNGKDPSLNQIEKGLVREAMVQIQLAMGDVEEQQHVIDAQNNIKDTGNIKQKQEQVALVSNGPPRPNLH